METTFEEVLAKTRKLVWPVVDSYLKDPKFPSAFAIPSKYKALQKLSWKIIREYPQRKGKYGRAALVLLTAGALGGSVKEAINTAAAMQMSEDWLLIHDDFEDDSEKRRGGPTLHRMYGEGLAVNAGDFLHALMWKILFDNRKILGMDKTFLIMEEFYRMLVRTCHGQAVEIVWTKENKAGLTDKDWFFIADGKTSYYTIATPMRLGAIIAGATKTQLEVLADFGKVLGRCFQLVDDLLDVTGDFRGLKKQTGNDIYEGKRTLILGHLLRVSKKETHEKILQILAKKRDQKTSSEVNWIIGKMHDQGSISYARSVAKKLQNQARKMFESELVFLSKEPFRSQLLSGISFMLERDY